MANVLTNSPFPDDFQGRTQELAEGCCTDQALHGQIQQCALGGVASNSLLPLLFPLLSLVLPLPPLTFPSLPLSSPRLRRRAPLNQLGGLGSAVISPSRVQGKAPTENDFGALCQKATSSNRFQYFEVDTLENYT